MAVWPWRGRWEAGSKGSGADPPEWFGHEGIDLRIDAQLALLDDFADEAYQAMFEALRGNPALQGATSSDSPVSSRSEAPPLVRNGYFPTPDAELYAAMIMRQRPTRIVEVGSGYSTLVARHAIDRCGLGTTLHVVDPEPRTDVQGVADTVELRRVEAGGLSVERGTILFIDSSHAVVPGGDGPYLYCDLLPSLPPGVLVHVHDIYLPYDYPAVYVERGYAEQYLLHALLAENDSFEVVCAAYLLSRRHPDAMRAVFGDAVARNGTLEGASFWIRTA